MDIKKLNEAIAKALKEELKPIKAIKPTKEQQEFLDYIKEQIKNEVGISYGEYADLEDLQPQIVYLGDIELAQYAGIDEEVWNISTSMPEHLKPVKANKTALKEVRGRSYKVLEIKLVKANKKIDVSSILKAIEALEYAESLHVINYSLSDRVIRVEVFTFSDANIDENRLISDLSKVVNVEGVTIKPTRVDNETVKESVKSTKTYKKTLKEEHTNSEIVDATIVGKYDISYNVKESGEVYLHKVDGKVFIEYRLPKISGCSTQGFDTVDDAIKDVEKDIKKTANVSDIEFIAK